MANRRWALAGVLLLVLADGALALSFRYEGERSGAGGVVWATTIFLGTAAVLLTAFVWRRRIGAAALAWSTPVFAATLSALVIAWTSDPCRYHGCVWFAGDDGGFVFWSVVAAALTAAALWGFYVSAVGFKRWWRAKLAALSIAVFAAMFGAYLSSMPTEIGPFLCGPLVPYASPAPEPSTPC